MKKLIASLLVLVFGVTMVMAETKESPKTNGDIQLNNITELTEEQFENVFGQLLNEQEIVTIKGGMLPDMDGSVIYGSGAKKTVMNSDYVPTKSQIKSSINEIKKTAVVAADITAGCVGLYAIKNPSVPKAVQYAAGAYGLGRTVQQCSNF